MLSWLDKALELFGSVALERPINISTDFSPHELKIFRKGYLQLLSVRATGTGRRIVCALPYDEEYYTSKQVIFKIFMYICWVIGNDIDTQRKGFIFIIMFDSSFYQIPHILGAGVLVPSTQWLPAVRISAMHICTPDTPFFRLRRSFLTMAIGSHNRARLKLHIGTSIELRYIIQVYGIPIEFIPITYTGKIKLLYVRQWLRIRNMIENQDELRHKMMAPELNSNTSTIINTNTIDTNTISSNDDSIVIVEAPYLNDILFKMGVSLTNHPGNNTLRNLIDSKVKQLHESYSDNPSQQQFPKKDIKKTLLFEIMDEIVHKYGGRFLYWHQDKTMSDVWWVLMQPNGNNGNDKKLILQKIEHLFRKSYLVQQQQHQKRIKTKHIMKQQQQQQLQSIQKTNTTAATDINSNCNISNDRRIINDPPVTTTTSTTTTVNQNGGTFLFHSLDGKNSTNCGNGNKNDSNTTMAITSSSPSRSSSSSECFGMNFFSSG